jgi:hypothetical protein
MISNNILIVTFLLIVRYIHFNREFPRSVFVKAIIRLLCCYFTMHYNNRHQTARFKAVEGLRHHRHPFLLNAEL